MNFGMRMCDVDEINLGARVEVKAQQLQGWRVEKLSRCFTRT